MASAEWMWSDFGVESGLPGGPILSMTETDDGALWALSYNGVARFDGHLWRPYRVEGLPDRGFTRIDAVPGGGALLRTGQELFRVRRSAATRLALDLADGETIVDAVTVPSGETIVATTTRMLVGSSAGWRELALPSERNTWIRLRRSDNRIFALDGTGVFELQDDAWVRRLSQENLQFSEIAVVAGRIHAAEEVGERVRIVTVGPSGAPTYEDVPFGPQVRDFVASEAGDFLLLSGAGGVLARGTGGWREEVFPGNRGAGADGAFYSSRGDLWIRRDGRLHVRWHRPNRWTSWPLFDVGSEVPGVNAILQRTNGEWWFGTSAGLTVRRADGSVEDLMAIEGRRIASVTGIAEDLEGRVWISSGGAFTGAYRFQDGAWSHIGSEQGLPDERYHRIERDPDGTLWFLGLGAIPGEEGGQPGAYSYDGMEFKRWSEEEGLPSGRVYSFVSTREGIYWFGTDRGLSRWDHGTWRHWDTADGLRFQKVFTVEVDHRRRIWFAHQNDGQGLGYLDRGTITYVPEVDGFPDGRVWEIHSDPAGDLWIGSWGGVGLISGDVVTHFGTAEGLATPFVWPIWPTSSSVLLGTGGGGVVELSTAEAGNPPPVVVPGTATTRDGTTGFTWSVFPFRGEQKPQHVQTRFRINGGPWSIWSGDHGFTRDDLAGGEHQVEIQSKSLFGVAAEPVAATVAVPVPLIANPFVRLGGALWALSMAVAAGVLARRRRAHQRELGRQDRYFRLLIENASDMIFVLDPEGECRYASPSTSTVLERDAEELTGHGIAEFVHPLDVDHLRAALAGVANRPEVVRALSVRLGPPGGERWRTIELVLRGVRFGQSDSMIVLHGRDRTDQLATEAQLRQAMKMDAVGQLTGGVAHDFNNILTVIMTEIDLALEAGAPQDLLLAREAAERGAELTGRLLSFSRRQALAPERVDAATLVRRASSLLEPALGDAVVLELALPRETPVVQVDRGQFDHALLNLAINARDAMPQGGRVRIEVRTARLDDAVMSDGSVVTAGAYVEISVTDDGCGIDSQLMGSVLDPFFTTKPVGKGSGLGLSMVYGFVKQSRGHLELESTPGRGTTVRMFFPTEAEGGRDPEGKRLADARAGG